MSLQVLSVIISALSLLLSVILVPIVKYILSKKDSEIESWIYKSSQEAKTELYKHLIKTKEELGEQIYEERTRINVMESMLHKDMEAMGEVKVELKEVRKSLDTIVQRINDKISDSYKELQVNLSKSFEVSLINAINQSRGVKDA